MLPEQAEEREPANQFGEQFASNAILLLQD